MTARAIRLELRCLINAERAGHGLPLLRPNAALARAAQSHAQDMVRRRYVSHYSRAGRGPASRIAGSGYLKGTRDYTMGENIACQQVRDVGGVVTQWIASSAHRHTLLRPSFRELGIGVAQASPSGDARGLTVVVDFGGRTLSARGRPGAARGRWWSSGSSPSSQQGGLRADSSRL